MKTINPIILAFGTILIPTTLIASPRSSTNYEIPAETYNAGGGTTTSATYGFTTSIGRMIGMSSSATYSINHGFELNKSDEGDIGNEPPIAIEDGVIQTDAGQPVIIDVASNDMDVDGSLNRHVVDLDGVDGVITWKNLGLNGTSQVSKFIRFRTTDTNAVLFDVELGPAEGGLVIQNGMLQLRCFFQTNSLQKIDMVSTGLAANGE